MLRTTTLFNTGQMMHASLLHRRQHCLPVGIRVLETAIEVDWAPGMECFPALEVRTLQSRPSSKPIGSLVAGFLWCHTMFRRVLCQCCQGIALSISFAATTIVLMVQAIDMASLKKYACTRHASFR